MLVGFELIFQITVREACGVNYSLLLYNFTYFLCKDETLFLKSYNYM